MSKRGILKLGGFVGTVGAGAMLVATAAGGTGAWFTDSKDGSLTAQAGSLHINTSGETNLVLTGLMPGEDRASTIGYDVTASSGKVDVWVKFDQSTLAYAKFTGAKGENGYADGGIGRYGHFAVANDSGTVFNSYNLQNASAGVSGCADANGHGSNSPATSVSDTPAYCGVPGYIKVASGLENGQGGHVTLTFGLTGRQTQENQLQADHVPFQIVATQAGHAPDAANF